MLVFYLKNIFFIDEKEKLSQMF